MKQYIVNCTKEERVILYNYLINNGYKPYFNQEYINNTFPFVIEPNKTFWICESITCCACATQTGNMLTLDEYMKTKGY